LEIKQQYKIILFDLDGTLTDPKIGITKGVQYALKSYGIIENNLDILEKFIGPPLKDSFIKYYNLTESEALNAIEIFREYFKTKGLYENSIYPDIKILLQTLVKKGKTLAVATSKPTIFAKKILKHFKIDKYFSLVIGSNLDGSRVNKEEVIRETLKQLKIYKYDNVIMIGDRKYDILGAKKVGIHSVGIIYGYGSLKEIKQTKPDYMVKTVKELEKIL